MPPLIVIVITLPWQRKDCQSAPPFNQSLALLTAAIDTFFFQLRSTYPQSHIMLVWNEYGIFDAFTETRHSFLSYEKKLQFKQEIENLLIGKDEITIVAGTIAHFRNVFYKQHKEMYRQIRESLRVKNSCYIFTRSNGCNPKCYAYHKVMPHFELSAFRENPRRNPGIGDAFFKSGIDCLAPIEFDSRYGGLTLAVEVCLDHAYGGLLAQKCAYSGSKPNLQIIVSDTVTIEEQHIVAQDCVVYADGQKPPQVIRRSNRLKIISLNGLVSESGQTEIVEMK